MTKRRERNVELIHKENQSKKKRVPHAPMAFSTIF
jgi:hypothetical protein